MDKLGGFKQKAAVVFYLADSFTGRAVTSARISGEGAFPTQPFINKRDGYYVCSNLPPGNYTFVIEAPDYLSLQQELTLTAGAGPAVQQLCLQHAPGSRIIADSTRIAAVVETGPGEVLPGSTVRVAVISPRAYGRLSETAEQGADWLRFYSKEGTLLEGKEFLLGEAENRESIRITAYDRAADRFLLEAGLLKGHNSGSRLYPSWELRTGAKGEFVLPLPAGTAAAGEAVEVIVWYAGKRGRGERKLLPGKINRLTILLQGEEQA